MVIYTVSGKKETDMFFWYYLLENSVNFEKKLVGSFANKFAAQPALFVIVGLFLHIVRSGVVV